MAIYKVKNSPFYYTRFMVRGRRISQSTKEVSRSEALRFEEMRKQQVKEELIYGVKPLRTFKEAAARWLIEMSHKRSIRQDSAYIQWLKDEDLLQLKLVEITRDKIEEVIDRKGLKKTSCNRLLSLINSILKKALLEWGWIDKMPKIRRFKENKGRIRYITKEEAKTLLDLLPDHLADLANFSLQTGQRIGNILTMKWDEIDIQRKVWFIPREKFKTNITHSVPLNITALNILKKWKLLNTKHVFTYKGRRIKQCNTRAFRKALEKAEIENFRWHDFRHTFASWLVQSGVGLNVVQSLLGHANIQTTMIYAHLAPIQLLDAVNLIPEI